MKKIGVIGIGSLLRKDDGIGIVLLEKLSQNKNNNLPKNIEYVDGGTGGMNLLHILPLFDTVLIIDAVNFGGKPGEFKLFKSDEVCSKKTPVNISTHENNVLKVIQLSKELGEDPDELFIFGVQPYDTSSCDEISSELKQRIDSIFDNLMDALTSIVTN